MMSYEAPTGSDCEVENLTVSLRSTSAMSSSRGEDNPTVPRGRVGSGPRQASADNLKNRQTNDNYAWKEQIHTMAKSDSESEISDSEHFLTKGAFLLTPSHDLSMEKASTICEKMPFKGCFSLTRTATGILFKFSDFDDYQSVYKKGFHKVTNSRFYRKVIIPCRPQKMFTIFVFDIPDDLPEDDIRHSLYKFSSVVEVVRVQVSSSQHGAGTVSSTAKATTDKTVPRRTSLTENAAGSGETGAPAGPPPPPTSAVRVTLASIEECNILLQNGLDFYGATYFPTELAMPQQAARLARPGRVTGGSISARVRDLLPVFDNAGFSKLPPPAMKMIKPRGK